MTVANRVAPVTTAIFGTGPTIPFSTTGAVVGDLMVRWLNSAGVLTPPAGWTVETSGLAAADFQNWGLWYRYFQAGDGASFNFDSGASTSANRFDYILSGVDPTVPFMLVFAGAGFESALVSGNANYVHPASSNLNRDGSKRLIHGFDDNNVNTVNSVTPAATSGTSQTVGAVYTGYGYQDDYGVGTTGAPAPAQTVAFANAAFGRRVQVIANPALASSVKLPTRINMGLF